MGVLVLPVDFVCRIPFICSLVECESHIVCAVAFVLEHARGASVIVHDIDSYNVSVAESFVICPCGIFLTDRAGYDDGLSVCIFNDRVETRFVECARSQAHESQRSDDVS